LAHRQRLYLRPKGRSFTLYWIKMNKEPTIEKISHWIRQDNASAVARWLEQSKVDENILEKIVEQLYVARSLKTLDVIFKKSNKMLYPWGIQETPSKILEIWSNWMRASSISKILRVPDDGTNELLDYYAKFIDVAEKDGWVPTANWGARLTKLADIQNSDILKRSISKIKPNEKVSNVDGMSIWADCVVDSYHEWADDIWENMFLGVYKEEMTSIDRDWSKWTLASYGSGTSRITRCLKGLEASVLRGSILTDIEMNEIKEKYVLLKWRRMSKMDDDENFYEGWKNWNDRKKIMELSGVVKQKSATQRQSV
jgi:hypothetical protein